MSREIGVARVNRLDARPDRSAQNRDGAERPARIIGFARDARLLAPLTDPRLLGNFGDGADGGATNIASALTAAESLFAPEADKRIVLLSDGNETEDSAMTEVPAMLEEGVRIFAGAPPPSSYRKSRGHQFLLAGRGPRGSTICI